MLNTVEKSAEGIVGGATAEGPNDERQRIMTKRDGNASDNLLTQTAAKPQDELVAGSSGQPESIHPQALLAQVLERDNLQRALSGKFAQKFQKQKFGVTKTKIRGQV